MAIKAPQGSAGEEGDRRLHGLVEPVDERDADECPGEGDQRRRGVGGGLVAGGGTHQAALRSGVRAASDFGSCHFSATGRMSRLATNPTTSRPTMMNSAGR